MKIFEIRNAYQQIRFLDFGATIYEWIAYKDLRNIILNNEDLEVYKGPRTGFFGATLGRVANRIKDGHLEVDGKTYQLSRTFLGNHHGHGGPTGFSFTCFEVVKHATDFIHFRGFSPDGHEGYPGNMILDVIYALKDQSLEVTYSAKVDKASPINISNHVHFNLSDEDTILNHSLKINASYYLETDNEAIPTGKLVSVDHTPLDFREGKYLGTDMEDVFLQDKTKGIDHTLLFNKKERPEIVLSYKKRKLIIHTTYPSVQVYTMNYPLTQKLKNGHVIHKYQAVALECQFEPDAVHHNKFSNIIVKPNQEYYQKVTYTLIEED